MHGLDVEAFDHWLRWLTSIHGIGNYYMQDRVPVMIGCRGFGECLRRHDSEHRGGRTHRFLLVSEISKINGGGKCLDCSLFL
jgi:hypothetical protein